MRAEVLNGHVEAGDRVAIGVRDGNCGGIRVGEVLGVVSLGVRGAFDFETRSRVEREHFKLQVRVDLTSDGWSSGPYVAWFRELSKVVKLA